LRHRAGRHRQDVPGGRDGRPAAAGQAGQPHHPHPPGRRGGGAAGGPTRLAEREDRPVPAAAAPRAARHARSPSEPAADGRPPPRLMGAGTIEVAPLAYMRGRTLNDAFIILDEAQNTTPEQMKMFLTRLGFNSTMVVTGDVTQVDLPGAQKSGLRVVEQVLSG